MIQNNLRKFRKAKKWTLQEMGKKTDYDFRTVGGYETNVPPSEEFLEKAAKVFGVEKSELLREVPDMKDAPKPISGLSHLTSETLIKILTDLVDQLNAAQPTDRKYFIGGIREVIDELETKELTENQVLIKHGDKKARENPRVIYGRPGASSGKSPAENIEGAIVEDDEKGPSKNEPE